MFHWSAKQLQTHTIGQFCCVRLKQKTKFWKWYNFLLQSSLHIKQTLEYFNSIKLRKDNLLKVIKHKMTSTTFFSFSLYSPSRLFTDKHKGRNLSYFRSVFDPASPLLVSFFTWSACPMRSRPYVLSRVDRSHMRTPRHTPLSPPLHLQIHAELLHQSERCNKASALFCVPWYDNTIKHYDLDSPLLSDHWKTWKDDWSETINQQIFFRWGS